MMTLRKLHAEWSCQWESVWKRDPWTSEYRDDVWVGMRERCYFDHEKGELLFTDYRNLSELPNEILANNERRIGQDPDRYEEIPPLTHADHHEIFNEFLATLDEKVREVCQTKSIGGFFDTYEEHFGQSDEVRWAWESFHDDALRARAEEWLSERGWEVHWS